jgi:hypothetical protein
MRNIVSGPIIETNSGDFVMTRCMFFVNQAEKYLRVRRCGQPVIRDNLFDGEVDEEGEGYLWIGKVWSVDVSVPATALAKEIGCRAGGNRSSGRRIRSRGALEIMGEPA